MTEVKKNFLFFFLSLLSFIDYNNSTTFKAGWKSWERHGELRATDLVLAVAALAVSIDGFGIPNQTIFCSIKFFLQKIDRVVNPFHLR